ncbi:hypothetical protein MF271_06565 [Deinococcus sp. KNUC1210]|uniref:hypothetical protein n=1 Tax=Deinococcus sp. KNUC1210 TaxID=2917691 RepID=UPI001EF072B4|nr:hypothetical protein [Deinococcus sp. KNUC1210]ULH16266.1 hypothetical protein MF271_06565 [Deinococcus sp. KNUC1210]
MKLPTVALFLLAPVLGACGWIPLPEQTAQDFYFTNSSIQVTPAQVAYMSENQLDTGRLNVPSLPYNTVSIDAELNYQGQGTSMRLEIFAAAKRPDCPSVNSTLPGFSAALVCTGPETGQRVAEVLLNPGVSTPLHLEGTMLAQAVRAKSLYLGIRLLSGTPGNNALIFVSKIRLHAWL